MIRNVLKRHVEIKLSNVYFFNKCLRRRKRTRDWRLSIKEKAGKRRKNAARETEK